MKDTYLHSPAGHGGRSLRLGLLIVLLVVTVGAVLYQRTQSAPARGAAATSSIHTVAIQAQAKPAPVPDTQALALLGEARRLTHAGSFIKARETAWQALLAARDAAVKRQVEDLLGQIHTTLVFNPWPMPEKAEYIIQDGDSLRVLAKNHRTTVELIQKSNGIQGNNVRPGDHLRILTGDFTVRVSKVTNEMDVTLDGKFFKRYAVGTGKFNKTPVGVFKIVDRISQPTWWKDGQAIPYGDTNNVLGTRWLKLNIPGYGLHGTWDPESIGKQASAGCVRLRNADIEELFVLLPVGTAVEISE